MSQTVSKCPPLQHPPDDFHVKITGAVKSRHRLPPLTLCSAGSFPGSLCSFLRGEKHWSREEPWHRPQRLASLPHPLLLVATLHPIGAAALAREAEVTDAGPQARRQPRRHRQGVTTPAPFALSLVTASSITETPTDVGNGYAAEKVSGTDEGTSQGKQ